MASIINQIAQRYIKRHENDENACEEKWVLHVKTGGDDPVQGLFHDQNVAAIKWIWFAHKVYRIPGLSLANT